MSYWSRRIKRYTGGADPAATYLQDQQDSADQAKKNEDYAIQQASLAAKQKELADLQSDWDKMPEVLRNRYTADSQRAGTYSNTGEFASGLNSEIDAGLPGAYATNMSRQNALQKELGLTVTPYDTSAAEPPAAAPTTPTTTTPTSTPQTLGTIPSDEDNSDTTEDQTVRARKNPRQKAIQSQLGGAI